MHRGSKRPGNPLPVACLGMLLMHASQRQTRGGKQICRAVPCKQIRRAVPCSLISYAQSAPCLTATMISTGPVTSCQAGALVQVQFLERCQAADAL